MDYEGEENNYEMDYENNEMDENMDDNYNENEDENDINYNFNNNIPEDNNDFNYNENDDDNQIDQDNNYDIENEKYDENDLYAMNMENIKLKNKNQNLSQLLFQKNNEINNLKINFSKQLQLMNQNLNKYKNAAKNYSNLQNEFYMTKQKYLKELKVKNKIILDLQKGVDIKDLKVSNLTFDENQNSNFIFTIIQQIKSIKQDILEEPDSDILNQEQFQTIPSEQQIQFLLSEIKTFSEKLIEYKNNNMSEILRLRNLLDSNDNNQNNISDKTYMDIINITKNLLNNNINDIKFPEFSVNDDDETRQNNIFNIIKILVEYIINRKNNIEKNELDEELNKRLKEMSELLSKSNQNLSISTKNNNELKMKYNELKEKYDNLESKNATEKKKLMNDLNKKNQQIKSLEHLNTRLSNQINDNKTEDKKNIIKRPVPKYGKINKSKNNKKINENNIDKINIFNRDEKTEKNLGIFLNKFTNGEYESFMKNENKTDNKKEIENIDLDNLKNELDKFNKKINKDLGLEEKK